MNRNYFWRLALVVLVLVPRLRQEFGRPSFYLLFITFALCTIPPIIWNSGHAWITLAHLRSRGGLDEAPGFHPLELLTFLGEHFATYSPLLFLGLVWAGVGLVAGVGSAALVAVTAGQFDPLSTLLMAGAGGVCGVLGRDWWLTHQVRRRRAAMLAEMPVVAELLALAVTAGEGASGAIERVCRLTRGELASDLSDALARARAGTPLVDSLERLRNSTGLDPLARFIDGMIVAIERGTPLAEVLRAQAADVREAGKRALLEAGGRREIAMMLPVVFLILPVTVLFALFPGLVSITQLIQ